MRGGFKKTLSINEWDHERRTLPLRLKVHIFWEGHKILRNLHQLFVQCTDSQIIGGDFAKFCGLLRIYELYVEVCRSDFFCQGEWCLIKAQPKIQNSIFFWIKLIIISSLYFNISRLKKFLNPFCFACTLGLLPCLCSPQS